MKRCFYMLLMAVNCFLFCSPGDAQTNVDTSNNPSASLLSTLLAKKSQAIPNLKGIASTGWYAEAVEEIKKREYDIHPFEGVHRYAAANHAQHVGFLFTEDGYAVKNFFDDGSEKNLWQFKSTVTGIGRRAHLNSLEQPIGEEVSGKYIRYAYRDYAIEYINELQGMRQNFILYKRPGSRGRVEVRIDLGHDLHAALANNNQLVLSSLKDKKTQLLVYDELRAWDVNNHPLDAKMELSDDNQLILSVDDQHAVYPITIDPLNHIPNWTGTGQGLLFPALNDLSTQVLYGFSVASAGDVNADGYGDIIVGVPAYVQILSLAGGTFNPVSVGAAFIYYGSSGGPVITPSEVMQPGVLQAGALFGFSVSSAGDVDGDGKGDVIIGAPGDKVSLTITGTGTVNVAVGKVYVYYGNTFDGNINTTPSVSTTLSLGQADFGTLLVTPANPLYGFSVSKAGDVNNDTYGDVIIGSPAYLNLAGLVLGGRADIFKGSMTGLVTIPTARIKGSVVGGLFGYSVATAGKVNNDSYDDVIIGEPSSVGAAGTGSVYVFHGSSGGITATSSSTANTILHAPGGLLQTLYGFSVSSAGDVNGDGRNDIIVGEPLSLEQTASLQLVAVGKAYIYFGSNSGILSTGYTTLTSPRSPSVLGVVQGNLLFGYSVAGVGDVDGNGVSDLIVGEPGGTAISLGTGLLGLVSTNAVSGQAYIYSGKGSTGPINVPSWTLKETNALSAANLLGYSVGSAGDVNNDGLPDIIVGAPNGTLNFAASLTGIVGSTLNYITVSSIGSAYVFFGLPNILPVTLLSFNAVNAEGKVNLAWATTSEVNADHFEVTRSADGASFTTLGMVQAKGNSAGTANYTFTDFTPLSPLDYYRLKMVDKDGHFEYSNIIFIEVEGSGSHLSIYHNPVQDYIRMEFSNAPVGKYNIRMISTSGQVVATKDIVISDAVQQVITISKPAALLPGIYSVEINGTRTAGKFNGRIMVK